MTFFDVSEITINYNPKFSMCDRPSIKCSQSAYDILRNHWDEDIQYRESFAVLLLSRSNKVLGFTVISKGGVAGTVADPKLIFQAALKANASAIILSHNHPSGNTEPSQNDIDLTKQIVAAGKYLDITVLDHIILTKSDYYSFGDNGII